MSSLATSERVMPRPRAVDQLQIPVATEQDSQVFATTFPAEIFAVYVPYDKIQFIRQQVEPVGIALAAHLSLAYNEAWGMQMIEDMLYKGLNPAAAEYVSATLGCMFDHLEKAGLLEGPGVAGIELGSGAGWSTVMTWQEMDRRSHGEPAILHSIDSSPYAVASTAMLLLHFGIPHYIERQGQRCKLEQTAYDCKVVSYANIQEFRGVILHLGEFDAVLEGLPDAVATFVYSNHGTAYGTTDQNLGLLQRLYRKLVPGGVFQTDSLDPIRRLALRPFAKLWRVLRGNNVGRPERLDEQIVDGEIAIRWMYRAPEQRFLDWLHYLFVNNRAVFMGYKHSLAASERSQQALISAVKTPSGWFYRMYGHSATARQALAGLQLCPIPQWVVDRLPPFVETATFQKPGVGDLI